MPEVVAPSEHTLALTGKHINDLFHHIEAFDVQMFDGISGFSPSAWKHESDRFGLWADNLGLYHRGHSSLDYRLREAETLESLVNNLLEDLELSLTERASVSYSLRCACF